MTAPFEPLELQLIKSSLLTRTDEELAEILERSVEDVRAVINELTGGQSAERSSDVQKMLDEKNKVAQAKRQRTAANAHAQEERIRERMRKQKEHEERTSRYQHEEARKKARAMQEQFKSFKTRQVDYSKMKTVRVNRTTCVQVPVDIPDEVAIARYHENITSKRDISFDQ